MDTAGWPTSLQGSVRALPCMPHGQECFLPVSSLPGRVQSQFIASRALIPSWLGPASVTQPVELDQEPSQWKVQSSLALG